jgi:hypothetical protein
MWGRGYASFRAGLGGLAAEAVGGCEIAEERGTRGGDGKAVEDGVGSPSDKGGTGGSARGMGAFAGVDLGVFGGMMGKNCSGTKDLPGHSPRSDDLRGMKGRGLAGACRLGSFRCPSAIMLEHRRVVFPTVVA